MYKHTQSAWWMLMLMSLAFLAIVLPCVIDQKIVMPEWFFLLLTSGILLICIISFSSLTIVVDDNHINIKFGVGLIRKSFKLSDIKSCTIVRNKWWYGWGIHWCFKGWLFNISGLDAVELLMNNGKVYRIGTDEPQKLNEFIQKNLTKGK